MRTADCRKREPRAKGMNPKDLLCGVFAAPFSRLLFTEPLFFAYTIETNCHQGEPEL